MLGNTYNKALRILFAGAFLFAFPFIVFGAERIISYDVDIDVREDSVITILETITYDFGDASRHGIYRDIPMKYDTTIGKRNTRLSVKTVSRDGFPEPFTERRFGDDKRLRIGDADVTITGEHTYRITYVVGGAFNSFDSFDELYWNAIPHGWNVPIEKAEVTVTTPGDIETSTCFRGPIGSTDVCAIEELSTKEILFSTENLNAFEGMTIAVALPKGTVTLPSTLQKVIWWLMGNFVIFIPLFVFLFMYRIWDEKGRDAKGRGTIIPEYRAPLQLTPIFLGSVVDGQLHNHDITADILYLAEQGYLTITRIDEKKLLGTETDYIFEWIGEYNELSQKERLVAKIFFGELATKGEQIRLSELKKDLSIPKKRKELKEHIDEELKRQGYFANKPHRTREMWTILPIIIGTFLFVFWFVDILLSLSVFISIAIISIFGFLMPKRTRKGAEVRDHILGFKEFLSITEKDRLDFHNAPERSPEEFMENLPYAVALGVEKKWAKQFEGIHIDPPNWYRGGSINNFSAVPFVNSISEMGNSMSTAGVTAAQGGSGTGGGGFSGGGGGGGGGGSW